MLVAHEHQLFGDDSKLNRPTTSAAFAISEQMPQLDAVIIRNLTYEVGRGRNRRIILNKINLTVPEGSIYGLLGPSGCGKTTMLRCVVGRIRNKSGSVLVFGFRPGEGSSEVPGRDVGYMPQEISIYEDFTIEETLRYFGKINRMHEMEIKKRIEFLVQFLDLPSKKRLVANLSGGQKRRVSLAAALVHSPPLLILDEPTVGVDPLLRQNIWKHLVTLTQTERISVIITTHYIEEARQANVVGLMRHGKILAENSPDELMRVHGLNNLEDVFLKLCVTDSSLKAAAFAGDGGKSQSNVARPSNNTAHKIVQDFSKQQQRADDSQVVSESFSRKWESMSRKQRLDVMAKAGRQLEANLFTRPTLGASSGSGDSGEVGGSQRRRRRQAAVTAAQPAGSIRIHTGTNKIEITHSPHQAIEKEEHREIGVRHEDYINEAVEVFSSEEDDDGESSSESNTFGSPGLTRASGGKSGGARSSRGNVKVRALQAPVNFHNHLIDQSAGYETTLTTTTATSSDLTTTSSNDLYSDDYLALQSMKWAARRSTALNMMNLKISHHHQHQSSIKNSKRAPIQSGGGYGSRKPESGLHQWWKTLMAVTWKNYVRLRRNPPVLVFQFMLPAIQVILFCLCIGSEPFDVPVAIVNDEVVPRSSLEFLNGLDKRIIKQVKYDNLTSAIDAVRKGTVWGAIHIPDKYSQNLQTRLIMGEEVTNDTISNGTIRVYPDLTNLHLALALETTFRETFINFARNSLEDMGYDKSLADLPIQIGQPVYGSMKKGGYLEFMAPGVVISISYVMATGLTALAFILERRDGLLERSLVSGVQTSQILLAHAINQVVVMIIQIFLVLGCTFFVFEIPSRGPFFWVVLLILLQGCTGMGFGLLVSAVCAEENTAVMMLVGTFYTNLILAGIIWPIEAMPHWLRPLSYAQPQTLPTDTLRHILSRGWGITETGVLLGFAVTIGWLVIFLMAAGLIFKYSG